MGCGNSKVAPMASGIAAAEDDAVGESNVQREDPHPLFEGLTTRQNDTSLFAQIDVDASGRIERDEFVAYFLSMRFRYKRVAEMWTVIEHGCKGGVSRPEFESAVLHASRTRDPHHPSTALCSVASTRTCVRVRVCVVYAWAPG